jgi:hypothetical protein
MAPLEENLSTFLGNIAMYDFFGFKFKYGNDVCEEFIMG